jgi:3-deoxy-D-manno-octulosonate 8-phosphate phosphatase (KDO 8-P phosphatase)
MSKTNYNLSLIKAFVFDVDGVLSPSTVPVYSNGEPCRMMNVKDGYAIQLAMKLGYKVAIITGAKSDLIKVRYNALGVKDVFIGVENKITVYNQWVVENNLAQESVAYMGDDIPDLEVLRYVGIPVAPADACSEVLEAAIYVSEHNGGAGAVRDIIEQVLRVKGIWALDSHGVIPNDNESKPNL